MKDKNGLSMKIFPDFLSATKEEKKMAKNTEEREEKKTTKKLDKKMKTTPKRTPAKKSNQAKKVEKKKVENKSVQNKVIENIKNFISKIVEMQEKVRQDEEQEKIEKREEKETKKKTEKQKQSPKYLLEYYDLPFRYNETIVKILAQTPKRLFVYWDISDKDRITYLNAFGEHFFEDTYPVLLVHNENKNYTREVIINDFANSWYLDISDSRDEYTIQLGRKFKSYVKPPINPEIKEININLKNDYLMIAKSNKLEVPNDHILFEEFKPYVTYRNVKTQQEETKDLTKTIFKNQLQKIYQKLYEDGVDGEKFDLRNPSSMGTSSSIAK